MLAARVEDPKDHQVRIGEEPLLGFGASLLGHASKPAEVLVPRHASQVFQANSSEGRHFVFGEYFLTRLDPNHARLALRSMLNAA